MKRLICSIVCCLLICTGVLLVSSCNCDMSPEEDLDMLPGEDDVVTPDPDDERPDVSARDDSSALIADVHAEERDVELPENFPPSRRWRVVRLDPELLSKEGLKVGDEIVLNLFPDSGFVAKIDSVSENADGSLAIRGRLNDYPYGYVIITGTADRRTAVNISIPEKGEMYRIMGTTDEPDLHYVLDLDMEKQDVLPPGGPLISPEQP